MALNEIPRQASIGSDRNRADLLTQTALARLHSECEYFTGLIQPDSWNESPFQSPCAGNLRNVPA